MNLKKSFKGTNWIPASLNDGWIYNDEITNSNHLQSVLEFLASKYDHSSREEWSERIKKGEVTINKKNASGTLKLKKGDLLSWSRPPWEEPSIPSKWDIIFDNQDILIINKPAGLPTTPGGGFIKHTLTELLKKKYTKFGNNSIPKPVHRLGRYTSGLLVCARRKDTRAALSKLFRTNASSPSSFRRIYLALAHKNQTLQLGQSLDIQTPISKCFHPFMGEIWNIASQNHEWSEQYNQETTNLRSHTQIKLIEKRQNADLLEINIFTGRPHQIRIHLASIGTPLLGDPLYKANGEISTSATPGDGGYFLHAHKLLNIPIKGQLCSFEARVPVILRKKYIN